MGAGVNDYGTWPPPENIKGNDFYWLHSERASKAVIAEWTHGCWFLIGEWQAVSPQDLKRRGWELLGPVTGRPYSKYLDD